MVALFTFTVFLSAALLFAVQPMVAKTLLPIFGGGSGVWTTCMLFYQCVLLLGYLYAHLLLTRLTRRWQIATHTLVLAGAIIAGVMFEAPTAPPGGSAFPVPWLLGQLLLVSGLPFFAIASAGPLLQGWFARTDHPRAHDPYFLYAASNAGSLIGLLAYPLVIERSFGLSAQRSNWLMGLAVFSVLSVFAALQSKRSVPSEPAKVSVATDERVGWKRRGLWVFLAFVPSCMLLGVTSYITTDIAAFPLLWVIPLAIYLLTMIIAFSFGMTGVVRWGGRPMLLVLMAAMVLLILSEDQHAGAPLVWNLGIQLLLLGAVGMYAHARLATLKPNASHLTEYYLMLSVGGALGGVFIAVVAPLLFVGPFEYHLALVAAAATLPTLTEGKKRGRLRILMPILALACILGVELARGVLKMDTGEGFGAGLLLAAIVVGPAVLTYMSWRDGVACASVLAVLLGSLIVRDLGDPTIIHRARTFYGIHEVIETKTRFKDRQSDAVSTLHTLMHGTTTHGVQLMDGPLVILPLTYYHYDGPIGRLFVQMEDAEGSDQPRRVGLVGLGSGAMAAYGRPGDEFIFFEIDPAVARIAADPSLFTYLNDSAADVQIRLGDGRVELERSVLAGEPGFDLLVIDAFSSDAIPVHLLTVEAMSLYQQRLNPGGVILMHITNRHLDLLPICFAIGQRAGVRTMVCEDFLGRERAADSKRYDSIWVAMTNDEAHIRESINAGFVEIISIPSPKPAWTDQSSNILDILRTE
ncbi:MAG: fused MFS/spermidine synthase [Phycisphaerales bacterium]|nr:fused MFS/spermidine synthase [Phycisphaerales bacterium]